MKRDWFAGTVAGVIGAVLSSTGFAALYHRAIVPGIVLIAAGGFMLLSAYLNAGFAIKNPVAQRIARVFGLVVAGSAIVVTLASGIAITTQGAIWSFGKVIENVREHFSATLVLLVGLCWLLMLWQPKPKRF